MRWSSGPMLGFDLESTSIDPLTALPVSFALSHFHAGERISGRYGLVDPGIPIPEETTKIHGITDEAVKERGGSLIRSIAGITETLITASDEGTPVVGMNVRSDLTIVDAQCRAIDGRGLRDLGWHGP